MTGAAAVATRMLWLTFPERGRERDQPVTELHFPAASLVVVGGPVGVGKSSFIARVERDGAVLLSLDEFRRDLQERAGLRRDEYHPHLWPQALEDFDRALDVHLAAGANVLADATGLHAQVRESFIDSARRRGRPCHFVYLDGSLRMCLDGQRDRHSPIDAPTVHLYVEAWDDLRGELAMYGPKPGMATVTVLDRAAADRIATLRFSAAQPDGHPPVGR